MAWALFRPLDQQGIYARRIVGRSVTTLNVNYRDFRLCIGFDVQFGLYAAPVGFNGIVVPEKR
jgi:ABC-type polysaccharide/polyol phosphate export permease